MIVNKTVCTCIKLTTEDILTFRGHPNLNNLLIQLITEKYQNRCYKKSYILKINKILERSNAFEDITDNTGSFLVNVTFEFTGEVFNQNDIITKCKLVEIKSIGRYDAIVEDKPYLIVAIEPHEMIKHYQVGDSFPCIIGQSALQTIRRKVIIKGIPFHNQYKILTFHIIDNKSELFKNVTLNDMTDMTEDFDDSTSVASSHRKRKEWYENSRYLYLFNEINNIYNANKDDESFKFFYDLMKITDLTEKVSDKKKWNEVLVGDYITVNPLNMDKTVKVINPTDNAINIRQKEFLLKMLQMQLKFIKNVKDLSVSYTKDEIKKYKKTWDNYKMVTATL